jgi:hypothetical protein
MATATKQSETVETITGVTLRLSLEEARTLAVLVAKVGGSPDHSPREHTNAISSALRGVGITYQGSDEYALADGLTSIRFKDRPKKGDGYPF